MQMCAEEYMNSSRIYKGRLPTYIVSFACGGRAPPVPDALKGFPGMIKSPTEAHIFDCVGSETMQRAQPLL